MRLGPGTQNVTWDGSKRIGTALDGAYVVTVEAVDAVGTATVELPFVLDATAPTVRVVSAAPPRIWVSEAATLDVRVNGARRVMRSTGPGTMRIPRVERLRHAGRRRARRGRKRVDPPALSGAGRPLDPSTLAT